MRVGDLRLTALNDGICKLPQQFYVGLDFEAHPELLADDGLIHIPIGCYVIRTGDRTVLIDAGLGVLDVGWARGGDLPAALEAAVFGAKTSISSSRHICISTTSAGWRSTVNRGFRTRRSGTARRIGTGSSARSVPGTGPA